ncbi:hypothetical protein ACIGXI_32045 [Kitasatospora aureofaciens]|uniref:hypothetical protein n=1 Tax=Kitasatospora aureofaciens TaxID=1894 RepID=UPI0037CBBC5A
MNAAHPAPNGRSTDHRALALARVRYTEWHAVEDIRVSPPRRPRIGLLAVRTERHRCGTARALPAHAPESPHREGTTETWAEAVEPDPAATALLKGVGAHRTSSPLELVRR